MRNFGKKHKKACILFAIALLFLTIAAEYVPIYMGRFSTERWEKHPNQRHRMIKNMERKIGIRNLSPDEIIEILGTNRARINKSNGIDNIIYSISNPRGIIGFITDIIFYYPAYYIIIFDSDEKVENSYTFRS